jgi:hypothetical protein
MATFAMIAEHPPNLCPAAKRADAANNAGGRWPDPAARRAAGRQYRHLARLRTGPHHPRGRQADDIESVRDFAFQSRLMLWNTVKIHATYSMEEALGLIDQAEPIF